MSDNQQLKASRAFGWLLFALVIAMVACSIEADVIYTIALPGSMK